MRNLIHSLLTAAAAFSSSSTMAPSIKLTYFDIEGAAEPVRLALLLSGTDFEDERVKFPEWSALKPKMPYGQLPVMTVDGGPLRTQSGAMLRWVGSKLSTTLYPVDNMYEIEEALGVVGDMTKSWQPCLYIAMSPQSYGHPEGFAKTEEGKKLVKEMREKWVKNELPKFLTYLTDLLERNDGQWLASKDQPTIADCMAIPTLRGLTRGHIDYVPTSCLETHPKVIDYIKRFCALDPVKGRYNNGIY